MLFWYKITYMKKILLFLFTFIVSLNLAAQQVKFIPAPVGYGTNANADDRFLLPFFKDQTYIYCSTHKVASTNPIIKKGSIVRITIADGTQFVYPDNVTLPASPATNAKALNGAIFFNIGNGLAKLNTATGVITLVSNDAKKYEVFDQYVIFENYVYGGLNIVDLNTNITTALFSPNNKKFLKLGASYYDNGTLYFRSQYSTTGIYHGFYKYVAATKAMTEIVGRNVVTGSDTNQEREEIEKINDNLVFLMKDTDYKMKYFSVNLTTKSLNSSFTFNTNQVSDVLVNDLMIFNNSLYLTAYGKVYTSDGATTPQVSDFPLFLGFGNGGYMDKVVYLNNVAYMQLNTSEYGAEIWKYDGTLTDKQLVKDITPGIESSFTGYRNGFVHNNRIIYTITKGPFADAFFVTDGTSEGTISILDHFNYIAPSNSFADGDTIYFYGDNGVNKGLFSLKYTIQLSNKDFFKESKTVSYPNPVHDYVFFNTDEKVVKAEVYDVLGRMVISVAVNSNKLNLSNLKSGNYILKIYTQNGVETTRIIKSF